MRPSPTPSAWRMSRCMSKIDVRGDVGPRSPRRSTTVVARIAKDWAVVFAAPGRGGRPRPGDAGSRRGGRDGDRRDPPVTRASRSPGPSLPDALARLTSWDPVALDVGRRDRRADRRGPRDRASARGVGARRSRSRWRWSSRGTHGRSVLEVVDGLTASPSAGTRSASWGGGADAPDPLFPTVADVASARAQGSATTS